MNSFPPPSFRGILGNTKTTPAVGSHFPFSSQTWTRYKMLSVCLSHRVHTLSRRGALSLRLASMSTEVGQRSEVTGELTLYRGPKGSITIPVMFGLGVFNAFYWSAALFDHYVNDAAYSMLGEYPSMGPIGLFGNPNPHPNAKPNANPNANPNPTQQVSLALGSSSVAHTIMRTTTCLAPTSPATASA